MDLEAHESVLLEEVVKAFEGVSLPVFVDGTLGAGGHAEALLHAHPEIECYIGIDQDPTARKLAAERLAPFGDRVQIVASNARNLTQILKDKGVEQIDGLLMDLGVSSMQLDQAEKGFSFRLDGPLDMRMNPEASLTAAEIVNEWSEAEIGRVLRDYGEEKRWRRAAWGIVKERENRVIATTQDLVGVLIPILGRPKPGKIHPMTLVFQGLRICVNDELGVIEQIIPEVIGCLRPGGRAAMISFHSLEDRRVKRLFQQAASDKEQTSGISGLFLDKEPLVRLLTRKPIVATEEEKERNPRSRSAKMRVAIKL